MRVPSGTWTVRGRIPRQPRGRPEIWREQDVRVRQARRRIARHAEKRRATDHRERGRLPGLHGDAVKDQLASCRDDIDDQVAFAHRTAAGKDDEVRAGAAHRGRP